MTHRYCYFKALLYLTSPLLTECESTTVPDNSSNTYSKGCYCRLVLHLGDMSLMVVSFTPRPLYPRDQLNRTVCGFQCLFAWFWQQKSLLPFFDIELSFLGAPAYSLVAILRLPQLNATMDGLTRYFKYRW